MDITAGNVWIRCAPGTILRAAGSRAVFRVAPTADKVVLTDADIRGRTKAAAEAKSRKPTAQIGRPSCRASVCQYVSLSVVFVSFHTKFFPTIIFSFFLFF